MIRWIIDNDTVRVHRLSSCPPPCFVVRVTTVAVTTHAPFGGYGLRFPRIPSFFNGNRVYLVNVVLLRFAVDSSFRSFRVFQDVARIRVFHPRNISNVSNTYQPSVTVCRPSGGKSTLKVSRDPCHFLFGCSDLRNLNPPSSPTSLVSNELVWRHCTRKAFEIMAPVSNV